MAGDPQRLGSTGSGLRSIHPLSQRSKRSPQFEQQRRPIRARRQAGHALGCNRRGPRRVRPPNGARPRVIRILSSRHLDRILEDRSGMLWLSATRGGGLASLDRKTGVFTRYTWFEGWPGTPGTRGCSAIHEDQHGMLWLATKPDGVVRFDRARRLFTRYRNDPGDPASLNNNEALSLLEDREGGIWVGTNGGGVNRFPSEPSPFTVYRKEPGNPNSLDEENVLSVFEDSQGILWIGTKPTEPARQEDGAIHILPARSGEFGKHCHRRRSCHGRGPRGIPLVRYVGRRAEPVRSQDRTVQGIPARSGGCREPEPRQRPVAAHRS